MGGANVVFLLFAVILFCKQYMVDKKNENLRKKSVTKLNSDDMTKIVPINDIKEEDDKEVDDAGDGSGGGNDNDGSGSAAAVAAASGGTGGGGSTKKTEE